MFINQNEISNSLTNISLIEPLTNYKEFKFESFDDAIEQLSNKEIEFKKTILLTSINSEYELLLNKYLPNISQINSVKDAKNGVNLILGNVVRPLINLITDEFIIHREYFIDSHVDEKIQDFHGVKTIDREVMFSVGDLVIHENYGLGKYEGLEIVTANGVSNAVSYTHLRAHET